MKILHITTVRSGSTGKTATDLKALLTQRGAAFRIAFSEPDGKPLCGDIVIGNRLDHAVHAFLSRLTGLQGYFSYFATRKLLKEVKAFQPDVVQLGNLHANYIHLPLLFRFLSRERIPVVMILHDCWFFTGKCTHFTARKCDKWKVRCSHCPARKADNVSWLFDRSRKMFEDRKRWYGSLASLRVIAVSDWEKNLAQQSPLFAKAEVTRVYNWIDTDIFQPAGSEAIAQVMEKYHLDPDTRYVLSVGSGWVVSRSKTIDAIAFAGLLPQGYKLIIVGRSEKGIFPDTIVRIPYTSSPQELSVLYSLAEAYIHFSAEDTFGKVIAEAMACGTVPIVFDATACGETAGPYGIAVKPHDVRAMIEALPEACEPSRQAAVRQYALEHYRCPQNMEAYWEGRYE